MWSKEVNLFCKFKNERVFLCDVVDDMGFGIWSFYRMSWHTLSSGKTKILEAAGGTDRATNSTVDDGGRLK